MIPSHPHDPPIELRRLRYFVAVARAAGFRQAALTLGIAQPPLSQQIMALEKQLGQRLFIRHARSVELTDAGHALLADAEPLLARAAEIPERLRRAATGQTGSLCLGFTPALAHHPLLPRLLCGFRAQAPEIDLRFREQDSDQLCHAVAQGHVHAAFVRTPVSVEEGLQIDPIGQEPLLLAVPCNHALAHRNSVPLSALAEEGFVMFDRERAPGLYDIILTACSKAGFPMRILHHAPQKVSALLLVASGVGITIVPASLAGVHREAVVILRIEEPQLSAGIGLATSIKEPSTLPHLFRAFCKEKAETIWANSSGFNNGMVRS